MALSDAFKNTAYRIHAARYQDANGRMPSPEEHAAFFAAFEYLSGLILTEDLIERVLEDEISKDPEAYLKPDNAVYQVTRDELIRFFDHIGHVVSRREDMTLPEGFEPDHRGYYKGVPPVAMRLANQTVSGLIGKRDWDVPFLATAFVKYAEGKE